MRLRDRLIKGTALNLIAVGFNQGSTLLVNIVVARILLKQVFGEYAMIQNTLLTFAVLSQLATGYTASKYIAEYRSKDPGRAGRIMGMCALVSAFTSAIGALVIFFSAPWLSGSVLEAPYLATALMIGAGFLFFSSINGYQLGALAGLEAFGSLARAGIASGIAAIITISLGAWWGGLNGAIIGLSASAFIRCVIHNSWLRLESKDHGIKPRYKESLKKEKAIIYKFALPAAISGYYTMPMIWLANSFLVRQPGGYGEMALFSAANNLRLLVLFLPNVMNSVGLSVLNNEMAKEDVNRYNRVFRSNVIYVFIITLGSVIIIGIFGRPILQLFGKDFGAGHFLLWLLLLASIFESLSIVLYQYIQSQAKIWLSFFTINIPRDTFLAAAAFFLVRLNGGVGLASAYLCSTVLGLICVLIFVAVLYEKKHNAIEKDISTSQLIINNINDQ